MITVVCWKWRQEGNGRRFESAHVNVLRAMVSRHLHQPHAFVCLTDDPVGLDSRIVAHPLPATGLEHLVSPCQEKHERKHPRRRVCGVLQHRFFPSCYRRLWLFSREAAELGDLFLSIDIDCVIGAALDPLIRPKADFVGWCDEASDFKKIAGGIFQLRAGSHREVWETFDAVDSPILAAQDGLRGSDQAWMSYRLYPPAQRWQRSDGLLKINWAPRDRHWPAGARVIFTAGHKPPWNEEVMRNYPWIREQWRR